MKAIGKKDALISYKKQSQKIIKQREKEIKNLRDQVTFSFILHF